ncbi:ABC transporter permease [Psychrobium sp. nBUS_13]|uniref:ABC transporter permease n=1 Tax=Psychrobium sp. nBUS_13 TaxID=3395319 RepID=UPI003EBB70F7
MPFITQFSAQKTLDTYSIFSAKGKSNGEATGVSPSFFELSKFQLASGRLLTKEDDLGFSQVALLGSTTAKQLFPLGDALGKHIKINHLWF